MTSGSSEMDRVYMYVDIYTAAGTTPTESYDNLMKKTYLVGPDKLYKRSLDSAVLSLLALISREYAQLALSSAPPVYIHKMHQNTSGSVVSELMRCTQVILEGERSWVTHTECQ